MNAPIPTIELNQEASDRRAAWKRAIVALFAASVVLVAAYWGTYVSIVAIWWRSATFAHGFLIVPIVTYLIWSKKEYVRSYQPQPAYLLVALTLGLSLVWLFGELGEIQAVRQLAVVAMIPAVVWAVLGTRIAIMLAFPLAYLFFAVPIGEFLIPYLQDITATSSVVALKLTGFPVFLEGRFISLPGGDFQVAEACSGVRYVIAASALGTLYAYIVYQNFWRRTVFIIAAVASAVVANIIRAYGVIMLVHLSNYQMVVGLNHIIGGWIFFGLVMFILFWVGTFFQQSAEPPETDPGYGFPVYRETYIYVTALLILTTAAGPLSAMWLDRAGDKRSIQIELPQGTGEWTGPHEVASAVDPVFIGVTDERCGQYRGGKGIVDVCLEFYALQNEDAKLISSQNIAYDPELWRRVFDKTRTINFGQVPVTVKETLVRSHDEQRLIWQLYDVRGVVTASDIFAKWYEIRGRILGDSSGSMAILWSSGFDTDPDQAREVLSGFGSSMLSSLRRSPYVLP